MGTGGISHSAFFHSERENLFGIFIFWLYEPFNRDILYGRKSLILVKEASRNEISAWY